MRKNYKINFIKTQDINLYFNIYFTILKISYAKCIIHKGEISFLFFNE